MNDLEKMSAKELVDLKANIDKELVKRKRVEYDKALKDFADALYELYDKFPYEYCHTDGETWEELYEGHNWNF